MEAKAVISPTLPRLTTGDQLISNEEGSLESGDGLGRVLGVDDLARIFSCSNEKIKRQCREGKLPAFKFGKSWHVREADLELHLSHALDSKRHLRRNREE